VCHATFYLVCLLPCHTIFHHTRPLYCTYRRVEGGWWPPVWAFYILVPLFVTVTASKWLTVIRNKHSVTCYQHIRRHMRLKIQFHNPNSIRN
jgi:hypothetical protein